MSPANDVLEASPDIGPRHYYARAVSSPCRLMARREKARGCISSTKPDALRALRSSKPSWPASNDDPRRIIHSPPDRSFD
jgi:hypothetical protein